MKILTIDTTSKASGIVVTENRKVLGTAFYNTDEKHSCSLLPLIDQVLGRLKLDIEDLDAYGIVVGPGSFTGLRIGISTIKGFWTVAPKPIIPLISLDVLATKVLWEDGLVCPILDARKNEVYTALYRCRQGELKQISEPQAIDPKMLVEKLQKFSEPIVFVGDGILKYRQLIVENFPKNVYLADVHTHIDPVSLGIFAYEEYLREQIVDGHRLTPFYLRQSEAEIKLKVAQNKGEHS